MKQLTAGQLERWTDEKVVRAWEELIAQKTREGWKSWADVPPFYARRAQLVNIEISRRFHQLRLFEPLARVS